MFDGKVSNYTCSDYGIEPLEGAQLYHAKSFPIPIYAKKLLKQN